MALIKCPECGKEVSDRAPTCIHCGFTLSEGIGTHVTTQTSTPKAATISTQKEGADPETYTGVVCHYQDKTPKSSSKSDSQIGANFSIKGLLVGLIPIFMLLVGLPLGNYRKGSSVNTVGRWETNTYNMYDRTAFLVMALVAIVCVVISALIVYLRRKSRFNFVDNIAIGFSWLSVASMVIGGMLTYYNNMEYSASGGVGVSSGSRLNPTFWYFVIVISLIFYALVIKAYCQSRKDTDNE